MEARPADNRDVETTMGELLRISDLTPTTPLRIDLPDGSISLCVEDILRWVAPPGCPQSEAMRFLLVCRLAQIDPFRKEAHLVKNESKKTGKVTWIIIIDKSGWLRMAERHPRYDGHQCGVIVRTKENKEDKNQVRIVSEVDGAFVPPDHAVIGGWAKVYRKDRRFPTIAKVGNEYARDTPIWSEQMPSMYEKTALVHALREAGVCFGYGGTYDRTEMPPMGSLPSVVTSGSARSIDHDDGNLIASRVAIAYQETPMPSLEPGLVTELELAIAEVGMSDYYRQVMLAKRHVQSITELSVADARDILFKLRQMIEEQHAGETILPDGTSAKQGDESEGEIVVNGEVVTADLPEEEQERLKAIPGACVLELADRIAADAAISHLCDDANRTDNLPTNVTPTMGGNSELDPFVARNEKLIGSPWKPLGYDPDLTKDFEASADRAMAKTAVDFAVPESVEPFDPETDAAIAGLVDSSDDSIPDVVRPDRPVKGRTKKAKA
jgi:phage recombination protein Bet